MAEPAAIGVEARPSMRIAPSKIARALFFAFCHSWTQLGCLPLALILVVILGIRVDAAGPSAQPPGAGGGYVGSPACAKCHREIYDSYSRTDMGRSMSAVNPVSASNPGLSRKVSASATIFDQRLNRHFETFV